MNRCVVFILAMCVSIAAYCRSDWYDTPLLIDEGTTMIDMCYEPVHAAQIHVRAAADSRQMSAWGIAWGDIDGGHYRQAILYLPKYDKTDDFYQPSARIVVSRVDNTVVTTIADQEVKGIDVSGGYNSIKVLINDGEETLMVGSAEPTDITLPRSDVALTQMSIVAEAPIQCCRISTDFDTTGDAPYSRYTNVEALMEALSLSTDPAEGVWEYLDRNLDADKAILGGGYTLATVRRGDGYDIVYLKGAKIDAAKWAPLRLKGHLRPTIFRGNYDMTWYAASGITIDEDVNAQYSDDGAILTLRFPILDSTLRLRRLILK